MPNYHFTYTRQNHGDELFSVVVTGKDLQEAENNLSDVIPDLDAIIWSEEQ
jgi:hypothetical protein